MTNAHENRSAPSVPAVFVCSAGSLVPSGGVGICTLEYIQALSAAGVHLETVAYETDRRLATRFLRVLCPRPYAHRVPPSTVAEVLSAVQRTEARFVFLNLVDLAPIAQPLKERLSKNVKIVLLSHGLESVDYLHALRANGGTASFEGLTRSKRNTLAKQLISECRHRQYIDHVFCLAPFEVEIERWLGAKELTWLPRTIPKNPLPWSPHSDRLGFVGCLDHPPNREGLELFAAALADIGPGRARLRVVGGPPKSIEAIQRRYSFVEYLGPLSNNELVEEASTWNCFVNPVFCYARGCSTKLAIGLGWGIPVITTPAGSRGYAWREGVLPMAETPTDLAKLAIQMLNSESRLKARSEVVRVANSCPSLSEVAVRLRQALMPDRSVAEPTTCLHGHLV